MSPPKFRGYGLTRYETRGVKQVMIFGRMAVLRSVPATPEPDTSAKQCDADVSHIIIRNTVLAPQERAFAII